MVWRLIIRNGSAVDKLNGTQGEFIPILDGGFLKLEIEPNA